MTNTRGPDTHLLAALEALTGEASSTTRPALAAHIARHPYLAGELAARAITLASGDPAEEAPSDESEPRSPGMRRALVIAFAESPAPPTVAPTEMPTRMPATRIAEAPTGYAALLAGGARGLRALAAERGLTLEAVFAAAGLSEDEARRLGEVGRGNTEGDEAARAEERIERLAAALGVPRIRVVAALMADTAVGEA